MRYISKNHTNTTPNFSNDLKLVRLAKCDRTKMPSEGSFALVAKALEDALSALKSRAKK